MMENYLKTYRAIQKDLSQPVWVVFDYYYDPLKLGIVKFWLNTFESVILKVIIYLLNLS